MNVKFEMILRAYQAGRMAPDEMRAFAEYLHATRPDSLREIRIQLETALDVVAAVCDAE